MIIGWHHVFFRLSTMIPIQHQPSLDGFVGGFPGLGPLLHMDAALSDELLSSATAVGKLLAEIHHLPTQDFAGPYPQYGWIWFISYVFVFRDNHGYTLWFHQTMWFPREMSELAMEVSTGSLENNLEIGNCASHIFEYQDNYPILVMFKLHPNNQKVKHWDVPKNK